MCANATLYGPRDTVTASYSLCAPLHRRCPLANVTHSVVFLKTYKTGGSTFANVLQRYARNRGLPMVEAGGHAKCATGQAIFRCDGPADKYYGLGVHTVSHLRLGGRNASAARVAQRCAPDIPLDTAAGWRACAARLALLLKLRWGLFVWPALRRWQRHVSMQAAVAAIAPYLQVGDDVTPWTIRWEVAWLLLWA